MKEGDVKKQITISVILVSVVSLILVLICGVVYLSMKDTQENEAQKYMKEIVSQYKNIITAQIDGDFRTLDAMSAFIGQGDTIDLEEALSCLEEESSRNDFIRMGFVSADKTGYFVDTNGEKYYDVDISDETFIDKAFLGEAVVSEIMDDRFSEGTVVCYGVPIINNGKVTGAVTATRTTADFSEIISQDIFDGAAYIHIIDHEGNFIIRSDHAVIRKHLDNVFDGGDIPDDIRASILADMEHGGDSFATFRYGGKAYWVTFIPVGINDWQIFCLVPQTFLNHNFNTMFLVFLCVMVCVFFMFGILFFYI